MTSAFSTLPRFLGSEPATADDGKNTIASRLFDRLREAILRGELRPGEKINLDQTRRTFEVSLSPLREALARLIATGLVVLEDNRGYSVSPVSVENLTEITRLRAEFEGVALRYAMADGDLAWESRVTRSLHRLNRLQRDPNRTETLEAWEGAHRDFHLTLLSGCAMPLLLDFCGVLHNLNDRYRRAFLQRTGGDRNVAAEHNEIAQGAVARDADFACERLREHIARTGANLRDTLAGQIGDAARAGPAPRRKGAQTLR